MTGRRLIARVATKCPACLEMVLPGNAIRVRTGPHGDDEWCHAWCAVPWAAHPLTAGASAELLERIDQARQHLYGAVGVADDDRVMEDVRAALAILDAIGDELDTSEPVTPDPYDPTT